MKIVETKINGISNPVGFAYPRVKCSWKVEDAVSRKQTYVKIVVSTDSLFTEDVYVKEGKDLSGIGEVLDIALNPRTRYYYFVEVTGENAECAKSKVGFFETGKMQEAWTADFISTQKKDTFHPEFKKTFCVTKNVKHARLYISGLGVYEAYLNNRKIGEDLLAPFVNDYNQEIQYQTYELEELLKADNELQVICGNGWYKGRLGYEGHEAVYGSRFMMIAELHIEYTDGNKAIIATDDSWQYRGSDIEASDIYDGEILNRLLWLKKKNAYKQVEVIHKDKSLLVERESLTVKAKEDVTVKEIIHTPDGETVLDFGQNFAGYVEFTADFKAGTRITLDFGETLQEGNFYNLNYRTAKAKYEYVSKGVKETVRPHFTFYGFRYVRVCGWIGKMTADMFCGKVVYSDLTVTGMLKTSDERINQLFSNCMWGQKSNFLDMPTDCPQRDERLGWTGDAQMFAPTASFNMDTRAFYHKFLHDLRLEQIKEEGAIPNYIPNFAHMPGGASVWGDAATFIPMTLYEMYGDKEALAEYYPMMKDWVDYITRQSKQNGDHKLFDFGMHFGDWLAMDGVTEQSFKGGTDDFFIASVYYYASAIKVSKAAQILGHRQDADAYCNIAAQIKDAILKEYFSINGRLAIDTQAAYLICLKFDMYVVKQRIIDGLKRRLEKDCFRIKCGFVGAPIMCQILSENGMEELAYRILFYEGFPGWFRCIRLGATTIWERWNSILDDGSISGTNMNSLNHYAYGSVVEFSYREVAGIHPLEPGFTKVEFAPKFNYRLQRGCCQYNSACGMYAIQWELHAKGIVTVEIKVPINCSAVLALPGLDEKQKVYEAGTHQITYTSAIDFSRPFNEDSTLEEMSGNEQVQAILKEKLPIAFSMMQSQDTENMALSLRQMQQMPYMGFDNTVVAKTIEAVKQVCVF